MDDKCAVQGCQRAKVTRGWCRKHYHRWKAHGDPEFTLRPNLVRAHVKVRFWSKVAMPDENGCMLWLDATDKDGYGVFRAFDRQVRVHRLAYELLVGPIPDGYVLDHVRARGCVSKKCCAPSHLEPTTIKENTHRGEGVAWQINAAKTECKYGHPFDEANTGYVKGKHGVQRRCRACDRKRHVDRKKHEI